VLGEHCKGARRLCNALEGLSSKLLEHEQIADQMAGHGLGLINPKLYTLASGPNYGTYFYDVTTGNNQADPAIPGFPATTGWDPVTGLGTPNAAMLVPALAS